MSAEAQPPTTSVDWDFSEASIVDPADSGAVHARSMHYFGLTGSDLSGRQVVAQLHATPGTEYKVWLDPRVPPGERSSQARSLAIQITAKKVEHVPDKILLAVAPRLTPLQMDPDAPGNRRYLSFNFQLDPNYEIPVAWVLHLQVWQECGGHPPLTMSVLPGPAKRGSVELVLGYRDDQIEDGPRAVDKIILRTTLDRGRWYHMDFELEPRPDREPQQGLIRYWLDGVKRVDFRGHWAYDPDKAACRGRADNHVMAVEIGTYRQRQNTTQTVLFDNIKYSASASQTDVPLD